MTSTGGGVTWFNSVPAAELAAALLGLTESPVWARALVEGRPYPGVDAILARSDEILTAVGVDEVDAALAGHPRIGERGSGLDAASAARSAREQAGMNSADAGQARALAEANRAYEGRFGRIYLVAAAGLTPPELLARALDRLQNDPVTELDVVRGELARITRLRLAGLLT